MSSGIRAGSAALALFVIAAAWAASDGMVPGHDHLAMKGVALGVFDLSLAPATYRDELGEIRATGANSICLPVYWYQRDVGASRIHPFRGDGFDQQDYDDHIRSVIAEIHRAGMQVFLMPVIQLEQAGQGEWRGAVAPADPMAWFESYRAFILHYAELAAEEKIDLLSVGSELSSMEGYRREWQEVIDSVREVYDGRLTYSANWDHYSEVSFWADVDYLGLSGYYTLSQSVKPTYSQAQKAWKDIRRELLQWQALHDKPMIFTEIGYASQSNAARTPWDYTAAGHPDPDLQRLCYRAFIDTWRDTPQLLGAYLWIWEPGTGGMADGGYSWRDKPSQKEIEAWYQSS